jgi:signal transduction histidine kinase/CheY-like chemotaxis protein
MGTPEARLERQVARLREQQKALVVLARMHGEFAGDLQGGLRAITETAARVVGVGRASVWVLEDGGRELRCLDLFEPGTATHSSGIVLHARDYPVYFAALETGRAIDAHDARADPRTGAFKDGYLVPLGITSMMDAAVREDGRVSGVVCHEHQGPARTWTPDEVSFGGALADQVSLVMAAAAKRKLEDEREALRDQFLHAQKLDSVGLLAGGVAHDFNNLLGVILTNTWFVRSELGDAHPACEALDDVISATERAARLARQLLTYAGRGTSTFEPVELAAQVREIGNLVKSTIPKTVSLTIQAEPSLPLIEADLGQLQQVLMNLMLNAGEAIGAAGGKLEVSVAMGKLEKADLPRLVFADGVRPGPAVRVQVSDTGPGMSHETLSRIFDPFFSTKGTGRGLGLSAVIGIMKVHGAGLRVESEPGRGTTFDLFFAPKLDAVAEQPAAGPAPPRGGGARGASDQQHARAKAGGRVLGAAGYRVLTAGSGAEGLELLGSNPDVDLVLVDVTMQDMSGSGVFRKMVARGCKVPVVMMSGYDEERVAAGLTTEGLAGFLVKPFANDELVRVVGEAMARARA